MKPVKIYQITNKVNGRLYVGQTNGTLLRRWQGHCLPNNRCVFLRKAIAKYGKDAFSIRTIAVVETKAEANIKEVELIKKLNSLAPNGYNASLNGAHTEEIIQRIALKNKGQKRSQQFKDGCRVRKTGLKMSEASRLKMIASKTGKPTALRGQPWSPARRQAQLDRQRV